MAITAQQVKELREATGAGMMDCKKALTACNGDLKKAKDFLREKGLAKAKKKASRIAAEGLCNFVFDKNFGYIYEMNSETDFVAKNKEFTNLLQEVGKLLLKSKVTTTDEALQLKKGKETVENLIAGLTAKIGEKITLRRVTRIEKKKDQFFKVYSHQNGKIINVVIINKDSDEIGRNLGMQVAASKPQFLTRDEVPSQVVEDERKVLTQQVINEGKPEKIAGQIVEGKLRKFFEEICLLDQVYIKDSALRINKYLEQEKVTISKFYRLEVGEGIEKKKEDFRAEVEAQIKK